MSASGMDDNFLPFVLTERNRNQSERCVIGILYFWTRNMLQKD